jgi:hypothetical protein
MNGLLAFGRIVIPVILQVRVVQHVRRVHVQAAHDSDQRQIICNRKASDIE